MLGSFTRWILSAATCLLCACAASIAGAAVLTTELEPKVGADYQPVGPDEIAIWQSLDRLEAAIRNSPQRVISPELDAYTRRVVERLIGRPAPELRVYVMHDSALNAAMLPSGMMIVNTGLLARVRNEAELAAVLGHEAGHYFRRHSLDLHRDARRKTVMADAETAALHSYEDVRTYGALNQINQAIMLSTPRFSRDLESEADAYGLMLMSRAGYPPRAAAAIWRHVIDERRASAAARHEHYRDGTNSVLSTHPPTEDRMVDLADTADHLAGKQTGQDDEGGEEWADVIYPYRAMLLQEQIQLNDPGASLYLLDNLAKDGWTGLLRFNEGEVYRLRHASGDERRAAVAYAAAVALADAPPEAWRAHGFALLEAGDETAAGAALNHYLELKPNAPDAAMIRSIRSNNPPSKVDEVHQTGGGMTVDAAAPWKRVAAFKNRSKWEDVWTWKGPQSDRVTLISGLPVGGSIVAQEANAGQRVPAFRADMTTQDLVSMVEVSYRVNGVTLFDVESVEPVEFIGGRGIRMTYYYVSGIAFAKRGSCVMRIVDRKLYAMKLESLAGRAFDAVAPEFDRLFESAKLGK